ncbi:hypothetical protein [Phenylobacterium immobile]|uniref:hypothetical protein n=1 Tax=Phenylobacterium immobile TaxID=21 RepID=UPI0011473816|nr:hypothetical protein [Phenylobacterium immobile]
MPRPMLQIVAAILALVAIGAFLSGVMTAAPRGRLPGEQPAAILLGPTGANIADAVPLADDRIEGAPEPVELTPEEVAKLEAEKKAREEAAAHQAMMDAAAQAAAAPKVAPPPVTTAPDKLGDMIETVTPPTEEPPF